MKDSKTIYSEPLTISKYSTKKLHNRFKDLFNNPFKFLKDDKVVWFKHHPRQDYLEATDLSTIATSIIANQTDTIKILLTNPKSDISRCRIVTIKKNFTKISKKTTVGFDNYE